jgi:phage RecT family recombinase
VSTTQGIQKTEQKGLTQVDKMMLSLMGEMSKREARLENLLPPDMKVERFKESVRFALAATPALLNCDPGTVMLSVMKAAKLGIDVAAGPLGHGALVPFGKECTFVPMFKGLVMLAVTAGVVRDMTPVLVYEKDHFVPIEGDTPKVEHRPHVPRNAKDTRGAIIAAYTRVTFPDGSQVIKGMLYADDIERIAASSAGRNTPWNGPHRPEMVKKSTIKNAFKTLGVPSSEQADRLRDALAADIEAEARGVDEDATHAVTATPTTGNDALKATLKAKMATPPPEDAALVDRDGDRLRPEVVAALPLSHPDAQPPEPGVEG